MSPTIFRSGPFRFYFFSREEPRMHVHVVGPDGREAKFWIEPEIELDVHYTLNQREVRSAQRLVQERVAEIRDSWRKHFEG